MTFRFQFCFRYTAWAVAVLIFPFTASAQLDSVVVGSKTYFWLDTDDPTVNLESFTAGGKLYVMTQVDVDTLTVGASRLYLRSDGQSWEQPSFACGTGITYQGHSYSTVLMGTQCWFAENLRATSYTNGDLIPSQLDDAAWGATASGASSVVDEGTPSEAANLASSGRVYNYFAVLDGRGLCPQNCHVPTDAEWKTMELFLGMAPADVDGVGARGTNEGEKLKSSVDWDGTDDYGFNLVQGGGRANTGLYAQTNQAQIWTSSLSGTSSAWRRRVNVGTAGVARGNYSFNNAYSIRCIFDY
jgi:uncharacterized protein (TIGR02145 family)